MATTHQICMYVYRTSYLYMSFIHGVSDRLLGHLGAVGIGLGAGLSAIPQVRSLKGQARVGPRGSIRLKGQGQMLHTNIHLRFLGSTNHFQAEGKPPLDAAASSTCDLTGVGGVSNTEHNITHAQSVTSFEWESRLTMSIAKSKAINQRCFRCTRFMQPKPRRSLSVCLSYV